MYQSGNEFGDSSGEPMDTDIAIVGMSCRFAGARSVPQYWANLRDGVESIATYADDDLLAAGVEPALLRDPQYVRSGAPIEDMECFDAALFGLSPRDAAIMDPQHRHFLECAWEALENAGHTAERFNGAIGVFGGSGHNAYFASNLLTNPKLVRDVGRFLLRHTGNDKDFLTTRASYLLNLKGPSVNVQTACSTSLVAVHMAVQSLLNGECDMALAGGASIELPHRQGYLYEEGEILSPDGHCRPFDAASQGTVFGSGVGLVVLRRMKDALEDGDHVYAVIRGSAVNNDGSEKVGYLAPSVDGQAGVITEALSIADITADTIDYVEAHGTGTPVGDPIEVAALTQAFRRDTDKIGYCGIGSVKANIGHTDTAAGTASLIKVALALHHRLLPPSLNYTAPNPTCDFGTSPFHVNAVLKPWRRHGDQRRRAGVSSLGVGGTNAHVVLEEAPQRGPTSPGRTHQLITLSAKSASALDANGAALADHLTNAGELNLADAAYTLSVGRQHLERRRIVVASSGADAATALTTPSRVFTGDAIADRATAFLFCGAGSQYAGMGVGLYESEPVFRDVVDACLAQTDVAGGIGLRRWLFPTPADVDQARAELERPSVALPALFIIQVALARLWMSWGVRPEGMIGHSSGEYAAAHIAGVFSLTDALAIVGMRGRLFETLPQGGMLSVPLSEEELRPLLGDDLSIAAINGPALCIASGATDAIDRLEAELAAREIECQRVRIAVAAHSPMLDPILQTFREGLSRMRLELPKLPFVSNLTGTWIAPEDATDPEYWVRHLRQTVRFTDGLAQLLTDPDKVLLEVGPGRTMSSLARQHPERAKTQPVLNSLRHPDEAAADLGYLLTTLGRLWTLGVPVNWGSYWMDERRRRVPLPTYCFDRERHWIASGAALQIEASLDEPLERRADIADWFHEPVWQRTSRPHVAMLDGTALVFEDRLGLGATVAARLRAAGRRVVTIRAGRRFRPYGPDAFAIDPANPADYRALVARLAVDGCLPAQIYHCWLVTGRGDATRDAATLQDRGFYSLMFLVQALAEEDAEIAAEIAVISDGMQRVSDEPWLAPAKATVLGPCRIATRENPNLNVRSIDIAPPAKAGMTRVADLLVAEVATGDTAAAVGYRMDERWVQSFTSVARTDRALMADPSASRLRPGGVYLITGGLGGLGLTIARHLAESCGARLALVARTVMPPRDKWDDQLATRSHDDSISRHIRDMLAIEAAGGEVMLVTADVCDARATRRAVRQIRERFGHIDGVFHAAGVLDDGLLQAKTRQAAAAVLAPKLYGTLALDAALRGGNPDFIVLFSSISAFAGLVGQVDYAAANSFLDAFAQSRHGDPHTRVVSVGWSQWRHVGMAAALGGQDAAPVLGDPTRTLDHPLLDAVHVISPDETIVTATLSPDTHWLLDEHRLADGSALVPGTGFLEIVRAAHSEIKRGPVALRDIMFLAPFAVPDGTTRELRVHFRRREDNAWRFEVQGRTTDATDWVEHVHGSVESQTVEDDRHVSLDTIRDRCQRPAPTRFGAEASPFLRFGPRWRTMRDLAIGTNEALLRLELPATFADDLARCTLHPALLDFATAGGQSLIPGHDPAREFFAPMSYGRVRIAAPLPATIFSHIRYRTDAANSDALAVFDVTLTDETGLVLVDIAEFTMIKVRDPALLSATAAAPPRSVVTRSVTPQVSANSLTPKEGLRVLDQILAGDPGPHLIVSPQDLLPTIASLTAPPRTTPMLASGDMADEDAPRTAIEQTIAEMWGDMLGVAQVRRGDNFFDLGGHSLLAVQFTNRLRKQTGKTLPLSALLETPTVERLAAIIDPEGAASAACGGPRTQAADADRIDAQQTPPGVVTIRAGGTKPPLFLVHDGLGETLLYRSLALRLAADHAVYGLEPSRRPDGAYLHTSIQEMASAYVERIRSVQPGGPYILAGLCAGGVIAFEMARQLEDAGAAVPLVAIFDAADVEAAKRSLFIVRARLERVRGVFGGGAQRLSVASVARAVPVLLHKAANAAAWEVTSRLDRMRRARLVSQMRDRTHDTPSLRTGDAPPMLGFLQLYEIAHVAHRPRGLFAGGDVVLFKATAGNGAEDDMPFGERYSDCILGWGKRVLDDVKLVVVPGGHTSILQEPHVDVLAAGLQQAIDRALARPPFRPDPTPSRPPVPLADVLEVPQGVLP